MKAFFYRWSRRFGIFLAVLGPGLITAVADNDAGGIATYTVAAATFGIASQFLIIPTTFVLGFTQEVGARIAVVTRKGLADLIRERYGIRVSAFVFLLYFIVNQGVVLQNISGLKASIRLLGISWQLPLILSCAFLIFAVVRFSYKNLQRIFLFLILFYLSYIAVAWLTKPDWVGLFKETIVPQKITMGINFWFSIIAVLGTTITAWGQFFVSSYINDKKLSIEQLKLERLEIYFGAILTNVISFLIAVAVTQTLFVNRIMVTDGASAALSLKPLAGDSAFILFSVGLFGASLLGLTIIPLATAYVFAELFGFEGSLDTDFRKGKLFYLFFILQIGVALIITLFPSVNLFDITLYVDFLNGAMLPVIFYFLAKFGSDVELMGKHVLPPAMKITLHLVSGAIIFAVLVSTVGKVLGLS